MRLVVILEDAVRGFPRYHKYTLGLYRRVGSGAGKMKTDKQIYLLLAAHPDAFRLLTGGIELPGPYRGRSVVFKELERRADHVFEPDSGVGPVYLIEIQAQPRGDVYDRLVLELVLYRKAHPGQTVYGLVIFLDAGCDEPDSPWVGSLGTGPLLRPVYLDAVLAQAREREPDHPLLAVFLPLLANDRELAEQAPVAWRRLENLTEPGSKVLLDVFLSWLMERHQGRTFEEIMRMLQVLTPLEETVAYQQLVGIGKKEGRQEEARAILRKQLGRRFGRLPAWAATRLEQAETAQLEAWAELIFDAASLEELLGRE
jgi:predicted transposase YdaD